MKLTRTFLIGIFILATALLAGPAAAQDCVEPPAGLVSWWPGDGDALDIVSGNDGRLVSGATFAPGFVNSGNGEAFNLNGYVEIADSPSLRPNTFTIDAWIFPTSYNFGFIMGKGDHEFFLQMASSLKTLRGGINVGGYKVHTGTTTVPLNAWSHVAVTYDGFDIRLYLDGNLEPGSFSITAPVLPFTAASIYIGKHPYNLFQGLIDEAEFFDRALSASEIQSIFDAGSAGKCGKPPPPPTIGELLERIEALEDHTHTYRTGDGVGHNSTEAETGAAEVPGE